MEKLKKGKKSPSAFSIPVPATGETLDRQGFQRNDKKSVAKSVANLVASPPDLPSPATQLIPPDQLSTPSSLYDEFKKINSMQIILPLPYKPAHLYTAGGDITKRWYIEFYYLYPGSEDEYKRFKEPLGINKIKTYRDRMTYGQEAVKFVNEKLSSGFNPFTAMRSNPITRLQLGLVKQLEYIKEQLSKHATQPQINSYKEMYNRICTWIDQRSLHRLSMFDISVKEARDFKQWALHEKDLSAKTVNNSISHLGMYWDLAVELQMAMSNPFRLLTRANDKSKKPKEDKDIRFEPITDKEMVLIFDGLRAAGEHDFITFLLFVYYAWARPVELLRLRVRDIELDRSLISFKKNKTKNGRASYVQIVPPLMEVIKKMQLEKYDPDLYLFSDHYLPGTRALSKNAPSRRWFEQVKNKLDIKKDLYALKHTGNIEYLLRNKGNVNLKWQQMQNRHSSAVMTETYNKRIGAYFIEIKDINFRIC